MYVIPREGYKIPDPFKKDFLPETGREVEDSVFWQRRLRDSDVVLGKPAQAVPAAAPGAPSQAEALHSAAVALEKAAEQLEVGSSTQ